MRCIWVWLWKEWRSRSNSDVWWATFVIKWLCLVVWNPGGMDEVIVDWAGVTGAWTYGVSYVGGSLLGVLEEWLLLAWRVIIEIGHGRVIIFPFEGGLIPSWRMNFIMRLQNGIHPRASEWAAVFLMVWKMWAQMLMDIPVIRSHRNWALPRLMKVVLDSG